MVAVGREQSARRKTSAALGGAARVADPRPVEGPAAERAESTEPADRTDRVEARRSSAGSAKSAPAPRANHGRASWLRRTGRVARTALLGALLVGASFSLTGSGASDHSAINVSRPHLTIVADTPAPPPTTIVISDRDVPRAAPLTAEERANNRLDAILRAGDVRLEYDRNFADPFVLRDGDSTYFYATNAHWANVPMLDARGMLENGNPTDALPTENLGAWAVPDISHVWAPSVAKLDDGRYAMLYSAKEKATGLMAVGIAYASTPAGPFNDAGAPLLSSRINGAAGIGGVIDASFHQENGRTYVVFKNDGNCCRAETAVWIQELAPGAQPTKLLGDAGHQSWEEAAYTSPHALIEGPRLVASEGKYYLFYSANDWASAQYGINYAVSDSLTGPYTRAPGPWMQSEPGRFGPGGQEIFQGPDGQMFMAYHAWHTPAANNDAGDARRLVIEPITLESGTPVRTLPAG